MTAPKRRGRPPTPSSARVRDHQVSVGLTPADIAALDALRGDLSRAAYLRGLLRDVVGRLSAEDGAASVRVVGADGVVLWVTTESGLTQDRGRAMSITGGARLVGIERYAAIWRRRLWVSP